MFNSRAFRFAMILVLLSTTSDALAGGRRRCRRAATTCTACTTPCPTSCKPECEAEVPPTCPPGHVCETQQRHRCTVRYKCQATGSTTYNYIDREGSGTNAALAEQSASAKAEADCLSLCMFGNCTKVGLVGECTIYETIVALPVDRTSAAKAQAAPIWECIVTLYCCDGRFFSKSKERPTRREACCEAKKAAYELAKSEGCRVKKCCIQIRQVTP